MTAKRIGSWSTPYTPDLVLRVIDEMDSYITTAKVRTEELQYALERCEATIGERDTAQSEVKRLRAELTHQAVLRPLTPQEIEDALNNGRAESMAARGDNAWTSLLAQRDAALAQVERLRATLDMIRHDMDRAVAAHDPTDPRHHSHGGQHHNGRCCDFGNVNPSSVVHMRRLVEAIDAARKGAK